MYFSPSLHAELHLIHLFSSSFCNWKHDQQSVAASIAWRLRDDVTDLFQKGVLRQGITFGPLSLLRAWFLRKDKSALSASFRPRPHLCLNIFRDETVVWKYIFWHWLACLPLERHAASCALHAKEICNFTASFSMMDDVASVFFVTSWQWGGTLEAKSPSSFLSFLAAIFILTAHVWGLCDFWEKTHDFKNADQNTSPSQESHHASLPNLQTTQLACVLLKSQPTRLVHEGYSDYSDYSCSFPLTVEQWLSRHPQAAVHERCWCGWGVELGSLTGFNTGATSWPQRSQAKAEMESIPCFPQIVVASEE